MNIHAQQQGTGFSLDQETQALLSLLSDLDDSDLSTLSTLGIADNGGVSTFEDSAIHLQQPPHQPTEYEWLPPNCRIELESAGAFVTVKTANAADQELYLPGQSVQLSAGVPAKFSVNTTTGTVKLKIHAVA